MGERLFMTGASPDEVWPLVRDHHYSGRMPSGIQHVFALRRGGGLFGDYGEPVAAIIYGMPVNRNWPADALELQRLVRLPDFDEPLSSFVGWSLRWLRANTTTPFSLSYADTGQGHHGGIYQATSWTYVLETRRLKQHGIQNEVTGEFIHGRQVGRMFGTQKREVVENQLSDGWSLAFHKPKFLYVRPLRKRMSVLLRQFDWKPLPYPKPDHAARLADERLPGRASQEHTLGAAPSLFATVQ